jgi:virginiamycin B lyase
MHPLRRPVVLLAATAAALAVAIPSTALAHNTVKEYPLEEFAVPADITTGPDGALWAPDGSLGRLWRVTTKGKVSSIDMGVGTGPAGVATGRDGALWVTDRDDKIYRVTTGGQITTYPLPTADSFPTSIVAGPDGALWFTEFHGNRIGRITTSGEITEYAIPTPDAWAQDITVGPDGALWFTESATNTVGRITTSGQVTEYPLETPGGQPGSIVARDGSLYFTDGNTNVVARMNTAGKVTRRYPLPTIDAVPLGLASTRHGLYVAEHSANAIVPLHPWGWYGREVRTKSSPDAITLGPDGNLWYTSGNESRIGRLKLDR